MVRKRTYTFDEMPIILGELVNRMENLTAKVDSLASARSAQPPTQLPEGKVFVPSHKNTLNTKAICRLLHVKPQAIYRMVAAGEIPYFKQGKTLCYFEDEIYNWMEERKVVIKEKRSGVDAAAREYCLHNNL